MCTICAKELRRSPSLVRRYLIGTNLLSCRVIAHPGIDKIVASASATNPRIHFIFTDGLHLVVAPDSDIEKIVTALHDQFRVEYVALGHCTGEPAFTALKRAFGINTYMLGWAQRCR